MSDCKRTWEAEALADGRLRDKDRESFERHAESCADCKDALAKLELLRALLAEGEDPEPTELERRRARAALLARANEAVVGGDAGSRSPRRLVPAVLVLAVAAVVALVAFRPGATPIPGPVASASSGEVAPPAPVAPSFEITVLDNADYTTEKADGVTRVRLRSGSASFHVEHVSPGARFLVSVPDGEVEVRGTTFVVDVGGRRTRGVYVTEGVVAVRVKEFDGVLRAGERWQAPSLDEPPAASTASTPPTSAAASTASAAGTSSAPTISRAGEHFARAMALYKEGDYGAADRAFVAFVRDFPSDSRAEDAMFLLADARAKRGDKPGAREAARAYLRRYPSGLRAPAATQLAAEPTP
ncbi:MAG: tetratricopeptide repeat protein [Deltaproteobacteria bacterium]|nr:tetratricopeptide repeat protein [Deltaproteobacteria bacterium]